MADHAYEPHRPESGRAGTSINEENLRATVRDSDFFGRQEFSGGQSSGGQSCRNCGYEIAPGMSSCPSCGQPVNSGYSANNPNSRKESGAKKCPKCGSPLQPGAKFCSNCGHTLRAGTVNAWDNPTNSDYCTLRPIAWAKEGKEYSPITYSGEVIALNRENTDPYNQTITSKTQAVLIHEGDTWYIEDKSDSKTTMLRIRKRIKLESGDVIALGNRLFEFKD